MQVLVAQELLVDVERALELVPGLPHHLLARALYGGAPVGAGLGPVRNVYREDPSDVAVTELLGGDGAPELELGDARERPLGIDMNHVAVCGGNIPAQVELQAVHPLDVRSQFFQVLQTWVGGKEVVIEERNDAFQGDRRHVVVARNNCARAVLADGDAGNTTVEAEDLLDLGVEPVVHTA